MEFDFGQPFDRTKPASIACWQASSGSSTDTSSITGIAAAQPPLATTRAQIDAGKMSRLPAIWNGFMNSRRRPSSPASTKNSAMSPPWSLGPLSLVRLGPSDLHLDVHAAHADAVAGHTCGGPRREHRPGPDVKLRSLPGARHRLPPDRALGQ